MASIRAVRCCCRCPNTSSTYATSFSGFSPSACVNFGNLVITSFTSFRTVWRSVAFNGVLTILSWILFSPSICTCAARMSSASAYCCCCAGLYVVLELGVSFSDCSTPVMVRLPSLLNSVARLPYPDAPDILAAWKLESSVRMPAISLSIVST